jgi:hypothetical protein
MGRGKAFDADQAGRQLLKERQDITALQLTAHHHLAPAINALHLKDLLSDVETDRRNRLRDLAPASQSARQS